MLVHDEHLSASHGLCGWRRDGRTEQRGW
jgi:hypothetical protein